MTNKEKIEERAKEKYGSFRQFAIQTGQNETNLKRKILDNVARLNGWLEPLELEIVVKQRGRCGLNRMNGITCGITNNYCLGDDCRYWELP